MPKPTFFQSVLGRPSRRYADGDHVSPWSETAPHLSSGRVYTFNTVDGYSDAYPETYNLDVPRAGPSRRAPSALSNASDSYSALGSPLSTPPRPRSRAGARPVTSSSSLGSKSLPPHRHADSHPHPSIRLKTSTKSSKQRHTSSSASTSTSTPPLSRPESPASALSTHKPLPTSRSHSTRKKSSSSKVPSFTSEDFEVKPLPSPARRRGTQLDTPNVQLIHPVPVPIAQPMAQPIGLLTPPSSISSDARTLSPLSAASVDTRESLSVLPTPPTLSVLPSMARPNIPVPNGIAIPTPPPESHEADVHSDSASDSDSDSDAFYTPRTSLVDLAAAPPFVAVVFADADDGHVLLTSPVTPDNLGPPRLQLQPPTPAAIIDEPTNPFHHDFSPPPTPPKSLFPFTPASSSEQPPPLPPKPASPAPGAAPGSKPGARKTGSPASSSGDATPGGHTGPSQMLTPRVPPPRVPSRARTRPPPPELRASSHSSHLRTPRSSYDANDGEGYMDGLGSENSFGARSHRTESVRSGYGKGGWAAAAAAGADARASPVMFMPTAGNDGWAEFQPPRPPSRFTPLPPASQPTFERGHDRPLERSRVATGEISANSSSVGGSAAMALAATRDSSPSLYSQVSDDGGVASAGSNGLAHEQPSRSYLHASRSSPPSVGGSGRQYDYSSEVSRSYTHSLASPPASVDGRWGGYDAYDGRGLAIQHALERALPGPARPRVDTHYVNDVTSLPMSSSSRPLSPASRPLSPAMMSASTSRPMSPYDEAARALAPRVGLEQRGLDRPSSLNPDTLTFLPVMSEHDSNALYRRPETAMAGDYSSSRRKSWIGPDAIPRRSNSMFGISRAAKSETGRVGAGSAARGGGSGYNVGGKGGSRQESQDGGDGMTVGSLRRSKSVAGNRNQWEGSSYGDGGVLMESHGREQERVTGYTNLVLPAGAYKPLNPTKTATEIHSRVLGLPHASMASITLSSSAHLSKHSSPTPQHLRGTFPPPVDFTSHLRAPSKVSSSQIMVQVYAVAIDAVDILTLDDKSKADVGKWVPGRSFVGRCLVTGAEEKDIVRGDLVVGLVDVRKSGALSEYIVTDRRRIARAPYPTTLTLEQLSLLPLHAIPAIRAVRAILSRGLRALVMDAHAGVPALITQEMARAGVAVTACIPGGDSHHHTQSACMAHGARGVLTGSPAAVMLSLEESVFDIVVDTRGGQKVYDAARRALRDGGRLISLISPEPVKDGSGHNGAAAKPGGGLKSLRAALSSSKRKDAKTIVYDHIPPAGSGEPEVDSSGLDCRDVLEEPEVESLRPVIGSEGEVVPFERGGDAFRQRTSGLEGSAGCSVTVVRLIN